MNLASYIEHTNLKADCTAQDILKLCKEAETYGFYGVCVPPYYVQLAKKTIKNPEIKIITVIGFPFGYGAVSSKVEETKKAINSGANEVDMVVNIAAFKSGDLTAVQNDIQSVVTACHLQNKKVKVIFETAYFNAEEIKVLCKICTDCEVDYVKTSTGFAPEGANLEKLKVMRKNLPQKILIKASGGIKDRSFALSLIEAGAARIGTSSGVLMMQEPNEEGAKP